MRHIYLVFAVLLLAANTACAASFDCDKAGAKVEKMICADAELSNLDEQLGKSYSEALKKSSDPVALKKQQRAWLKERSKCETPNCLESLYKTRLARLVSFIEVTQQDTSKLSEKEKAEQVRRILNTLKVRLRSGPVANPPEKVKFCEGFLEDFKQNRGFEYPEPKFRTNDYNHPELVQLRNQCPNIKWKWMAPKKCDAKALAYWLKGYEGDREAAQKKADEMCTTQFGTDEFELYEMDFGDHKEYAIHQTRTPKLKYDELDDLLRKPTKEDLRGWGDPGAWIRRTNTVVNVFFSGAPYQVFDFEKCRKNIILGLNAGGVTSSESKQGVVRYSGEYMAYNLQSVTHPIVLETSEYIFIVGKSNPICYFD